MEYHINDDVFHLSDDVLTILVFSDKSVRIGSQPLCESKLEECCRRRNLNMGIGKK